MPAVFPIFLDLTGRRVVIVGGGSVAERKAAGALEGGAGQIKVVALAFTGQFQPSVKRVTKAYEACDLDGAALVFAATDSKAVNDHVVADARARNIWVNRADANDQLPGDFLTPAKFSSGLITVAVSAGSAALTTLVRKGLMQRFDPGWATMADAMTTLRPLIRDQWGLPPDVRRQMFLDLATDSAVRVLASDGLDGLIAWLRARHPVTHPQ